MDLAGKKALIIKLRYIGDTLSIIPVVENLKVKVPDVTIDVMVNKGTEEVLAFHPHIRRLWIYDRKLAKRSLASTLSYHRELIKGLRSEKYDFVIDFTLGDRSGFLSFMSGAPRRISYQDCSKLSHILMNGIIHSSPMNRHIVDYQLDSLRYMGLDNFNRRLKLHIPKFIDQDVENLLSSLEIPPDSLRVVIHPGARGKLRQWRPERFAEIARRIVDTYKAFIILVGGPAEADLVSIVDRHMDCVSSFKSNGLSLLELGALLSKGHLFIGNDSAPAHLAAAVNCPSLTLFGPTFPHMWRPLSRVGEVVFKNAPCCGCPQETCIRPEENCIDLIGVDEVWEEVQKIIEKVPKVPKVN